MKKTQASTFSQAAGQRAGTGKITYGKAGATVEITDVCGEMLRAAVDRLLPGVVAEMEKEAERIYNNAWEHWPVSTPRAFRDVPDNVKDTLTGAIGEEYRPWLPKAKHRQARAVMHRIYGFNGVQTRWKRGTGWSPTGHSKDALSWGIEISGDSVSAYVANSAPYAYYIKSETVTEGGQPRSAFVTLIRTPGRRAMQVMRENWVGQLNGITSDVIHG